MWVKAIQSTGSTGNEQDIISIWSRVLLETDVNRENFLKITWRKYSSPFVLRSRIREGRRMVFYTPNGWSLMNQVYDVQQLSFMVVSSLSWMQRQRRSLGEIHKATKKKKLMMHNQQVPRFFFFSWCPVGRPDSLLCMRDLYDGDTHLAISQRKTIPPPLSVGHLPFGTVLTLLRHSWTGFLDGHHTSSRFALLTWFVAIVRQFSSSLGRLRSFYLFFPLRIKKRGLNYFL